MRSLLVPALILSCAACHVGTRVKQFQPARTPEGVAVSASVARGKGEVLQVNGELLEMQEVGLLLLAQRASGTKKRVVLLPFGLIQQAQFDKMGASCDLRNGAAPAESIRERLRRVSRFPQGLSPELLRLILEAHEQAESEKVGR